MYLRRRGRYGQAADLLQRVLTIRRRMLGDDHPDTLVSMDNLAETRRDLGDLHGARELHEQTLARPASGCWVTTTPTPSTR